MSSLPVDVLGEIVSWVSVSEAVKYTTLSRAILPACQRRIYYDLLLNWREILRFTSNAAHLLHFTRILRLDIQFIETLSIHSSNIQKLLKIILEHAVLERLEYEGEGDASIWELILQVSCLPSFVWLGISLDCRTEADDNALRLLRSVKLRHLDFCVCESAIVPTYIYSEPLPPLRRLYLRRGPPVSDPDVYERWAAKWLNLEEVQDLTILASPQHRCPSFPHKNQFEIVRYYDGHIDSLILQLPVLAPLKYLIIDTTPEGTSQIVRSLPTIIHFTFIIMVDLHVLRRQADPWIRVANFIAVRRDCNRFILRITLYLSEDIGNPEKRQASIEWVRNSGFPIEILPVQLYFVYSKMFFSFMDGLSTVT
ncbi:hypothetical protein DL96DRAFT_1638585 [Flagelloscypha sp. PMI_526]|nr:hypothetical protein DL96DRAFT_1638585 [Flagelloscypha sp. PMI_526]